MRRTSDCAGVEETERTKAYRLSETANQTSLTFRKNIVTMTEAGSISSAIITVFAWIVPHIGIEISEYCRTVKTEWTGDELSKVLRVIAVHAIVAMVVGSLLIAAAATVIALLTAQTDSRMLSLLTGMSRIVAAIMLMLISYKIPKWLGVYPSRKREQGSPIGSTLHVLAFNVRWSIWRQLGKFYFILLPFYCGVQPMTIPVSVVLGIVGGTSVGVMVYFGRTCLRHQKLLVSVSMAVLFVMLSSITFSSGCYYIGEVWGTTAIESTKVLAYVSFAVWLLALLLVHSFMLKVSAKNLKRSPSPKEVVPTSAAASMTQKTPSLFDDTERTASDSEKDFVEVVMEDAETEKNDDAAHKDEEEPTTCALVRSKVCCCSQSYDRRPPKTVCDRALSAFKWTVWLAMSGFFLYVTVVCIGSSIQQQPLAENLSYVQTLYYDSMNEGPVCAFDNKGSNSTIRSFDSMQEANSADFLVLHCGACGACSTWGNFRAIWKSRQEIADKALQCGRKTFLGGYGDALRCHIDTIGFDEACSVCWVEDEICARDNCSFLYLQSYLINSMANFEVGPNTVTAATCDEAMCGAEFLPCSGANRRRMDIQGNIKRPQEQQCKIVQVNWDSLFGGDDS